MSYDYNHLVTTIASSRVQHDLTTAVDTFGELSSHCPMTPLLWMQYASDLAKLMMELQLHDDSTQAMEVRLQTLELGVGEFPGCAILRLQYLILLIESCISKNVDDDKDTTIRHAFEDAIDHVASGSHRNEGQVVRQIYNLFCEYLANRKDHEALIAVFLRRAATPIQGVNNGLASEFQYFCQHHAIQFTSSHLQQIEDRRKHVAQIYQSLVTYEDDIESQMDTDHILPPPQQDIPWDTLLSNNASSYWNGLGSHNTAMAFIKYAGACTHYRTPRLEDDDDTDTASAIEGRMQLLALSIYERGVAECPTVEIIWASYLKYLSYCVAHGKPYQGRLQSVSVRAMRNCPYSLPLVQQKCKIAFILADCDQRVLDPDELMETVQTALATQFLPQPIQHLELYLTAIRTVKRRLLSILNKQRVENLDGIKWDDAIDNYNSNDNHIAVHPLPVTVDQEIQDFCEDLRDMYEFADEYFRKSHSSWGEGRMLLWKDRSWTERLIIVPLLASLENSDNSTVHDTPEDLKCFEKLLKLHQPTHPDLYSAFIQDILAQPVTMSAHIQTRLQQIRGLYHKAINNFGSKPPKIISTLTRDIDTAKRDLCHELLEFESMFGSDKSMGLATRMIQKKLPSSQASASPVVATPIDLDPDTVESKRKADDATWEPPAKKGRSDHDDTLVPSDTQTKSTGWAKKPELARVRVGKLNYPAHPYTVRVTNLADDVEDMDLIDVFRPKCGAIVHAKIIREKDHHNKGKSKGWGMVQFEERESVGKALELNGIIGIKEQLVKVDRSHMPATGLVPPGMHRVKPKGQGLSTKQNEKRKEHREQEDRTLTSMDNSPIVIAKENEVVTTNRYLESTKSGGGILAFQPRGVARKANRKGPKMTITAVRTDE